MNFCRRLNLELRGVKNSAIIYNKRYNNMENVLKAAKSKRILRDQAPGFFRYALGEFVVTAVYDGYVVLDPMSLSGLSDDERRADLARQLLPTSGALDTSVNAFLAHDGERLILIDAGSAHFACRRVRPSHPGSPALSRPQPSPSTACTGR